MNGNKKLLYIASSFGHLASFHQPYTDWLAQQGYEVHAAAGGEQRALRGVSRYIPLPFEKSMFSPRNFAAVLQLRSLLRRENYAMISLHTSLGRVLYASGGAAFAEKAASRGDEHRTRLSV